jgi:hypothetical protein
VQKEIYKKLNDNIEIGYLVSGVYNHLPQNTQFPYIHIGKLTATDVSSKTSQAMSIIVEINISREKGSREALIIMEHVIAVLTYDNMTEFIGCEVEQLQDGVTYRLSSKFKTYKE